MVPVWQIQQGTPIGITSFTKDYVDGGQSREPNFIPVSAEPKGGCRPLASPVPYGEESCAAQLGCFGNYPLQLTPGSIRPEAGGRGVALN